MLFMYNQEAWGGKISEYCQETRTLDQWTHQLLCANMILYINFNPIVTKFHLYIHLVCTRGPWCRTWSRTAQRCQWWFVPPSLAWEFSERVSLLQPMQYSHGNSPWGYSAGSDINWVQWSVCSSLQALAVGGSEEGFCWLQMIVSSRWKVLISATDNLSPDHSISAGP